MPGGTAARADGEAGNGGPRSRSGQEVSGDENRGDPGQISRRHRMRRKTSGATREPKSQTTLKVQIPQRIWMRGRASGNRTPPSCYVRLPTRGGPPYPRGSSAGGLHESLAFDRRRARHGASGLFAREEGRDARRGPAHRHPLRHRLARRGRARRLLRGARQRRIRQTRPRREDHPGRPGRERAPAPGGRPGGPRRRLQRLHRHEPGAGGRAGEGCGAPGITGIDRPRRHRGIDPRPKATILWATPRSPPSGSG